MGVQIYRWPRRSRSIGALVLSVIRRLAYCVCVGTLFVAASGCQSQPGTKSLAELVKDLKDPDAGVRARAAVNLSHIPADQAKEAVPALIEALEDPSPEVRRYAALSLGSYGSAASAAVPALQKATGDSDEGARQLAAKALKRIQP
jgi:HEAT repeat protein